MNFLISRAEVVGNTASFTFKVPMSLCDYAGLSLGQFLRVLGDISWELVSQVSGVPVYSATRNGAACYLGFVYIDIKTSGLILSEIALGQEMTVTTSVYADSVPNRLNSLVRLSVAPVTSPVGFAELSEPAPRSIYFNLGMVWISRSKNGSNHSMVRSAPDGYSQDAFPAGLPAEQGRAIDRHESARLEGTLFGRPREGFDELARFRVPYVISQSLDLNGVRLLYFASYPHIYQSALGPLCRDAGLEPRKNEETSLLYFGNADLGDALEVEARLLQEASTGRRFLSCSATRAAGGKLIGVCNIKLAAG